MPQKFTYQIGERVLTRCHGWGKVVGFGQPHMYPEMGNYVRVKLDTPVKGEDWVWDFQPLIDFRFLVTCSRMLGGGNYAETYYFREAERAESEAVFLRDEKTDGAIEIITWIDMLFKNVEVRVMTMDGPVLVIS